MTEKADKVDKVDKAYKVDKVDKTNQSDKPDKPKHKHKHHPDTRIIVYEVDHVNPITYFHLLPREVLNDLFEKYCTRYQVKHFIQTNKEGIKAYAYSITGKEGYTVYLPLDNADVSLKIDETYTRYDNFLRHINTSTKLGIIVKSNDHVSILVDQKEKIIHIYSGNVFGSDKCISIDYQDFLDWLLQVLCEWNLKQYIRIH